MPHNICGPTMPNGELSFVRLDTPLGPARLVFDDTGTIHAFGWQKDDSWPQRFGRSVAAETGERFGLAAALMAYFEGDVHAIDPLAVQFTGTPFQNSVWQALRTIPAGETLSYGALAKRIGAPKALRAVGLANGANPIGIIVPCHRVIGADGSLTGYGGGLERKRWLIAHEARFAGTGLFAGWP